MSGFAFPSAKTIKVALHDASPKQGPEISGPTGCLVLIEAGYREVWHLRWSSVGRLAEAVS